MVPVLLEGLKKLEYRGYDSAGIVVLANGRMERRRVKGKIRDLGDHLSSHPLDGTYGLGHTRWATHGRPSEENAHPHVDCTGTIAIVHNGIIENYWSLKERLKDEGHVFTTETDTEVIVHLIESCFRDSLEEALREAAAACEGSFAVACMSSREPNKIVAAKNGAPLIAGIGSGEFFVSSDINPLLDHTKTVSFIEDREIAVLDSSGIRYLTFDGNPLEKTVESLSWTPAMIEKRGFDHFMAKEIFEQPEVVRDTLKGRLSFDSGRVYLDDIGVPLETFEDVSRVVIMACGTSFHAGLVGKYFMETLAGIPVEVEYASEFRSRDYALDKDTLILAISQSGETADTLAALRSIKGKCRADIVITNNVNSTMAREAQGLLSTYAGPEIGVAATKTFIAQLAGLALLTLAFSQVKKTLGDDESLNLMRELQRLPHLMEAVLSRSGAIEKTVRRYLDCSDYIFLGRWVNFPVALEGALKLKEISYTHAEGYAGGEMKHGPIALIDEGMTTLAIIPRDRVYEKMLNNIAEVRARGGKVLAVAWDGDDHIPSLSDEVLTIPDTHQLFSPFLTVLPLQLFAYYSASAKGLDVDQPRNLAKSVTVE